MKKKIDDDELVDVTGAGGNADVQEQKPELTGGGGGPNPVPPDPTKPGEPGPGGPGEKPPTSGGSGGNQDLVEG